VKVLSFPDQNGANLALSAGRAQLGFADSPVAAYAVKKSNGQFKLVGPTLAAAPYGPALPKNSGLAPAVEAGVKALMSNGSCQYFIERRFGRGFSRAEQMTMRAKWLGMGRGGAGGVAG
jgi:polar amino acid transport system substrate-binding protein